ncbi:MAG TPA: hypothetical protein VM529_19290 [Gemmata sp.]|nr:hypothetical protein [Gemmata sp.]
MSFTRCMALAAAVSCGLAVASVGDEKRPAADDAIEAFVAYLAKNEVKLEADERNWWVVTGPKGDGYEVVVSLKTFPAGTSEKDMEAALKTINLDHMLNAPSRLAMSHPGLRISDPTRKAPKPDQIPVVAKLEKLFKEYRPPEQKK